MPPASAPNDTRIEIELLKKDVSIMASLCEKFDVTIDKMQEIASNLSRMVSLQEQRLENQEEATKEIQGIIEMRRIEHNNDIKELHSRITTVNRELSDKIEDTEKTILEELRQMREEMKKDRNSENHDDRGIRSRISKIENWQYMVIGAVAVITWILAKIDLSKFLKLIF
jgi:hypothetical protein